MPPSAGLAAPKVSARAAQATAPTSRVLPIDPLDLGVDLGVCGMSASSPGEGAYLISPGANHFNGDPRRVPNPPRDELRAAKPRFAHASKDAAAAARGVSRLWPSRPAAGSSRT